MVVVILQSSCGFLLDVRQHFLGNSDVFRREGLIFVAYGHHVPLVPEESGAALFVVHGAGVHLTRVVIFFPYGSIGTAETNPFAPFVTAINKQSLPNV